MISLIRLGLVKRARTHTEQTELGTDRAFAHDQLGVNSSFRQSGREAEKRGELGAAGRDGGDKLAASQNPPTSHERSWLAYTQPGKQHAACRGLNVETIVQYAQGEQKKMKNAQQ